MKKLNEYLQDLQDEGVIHQEVKSHIMYLVKITIDELNDEIDKLESELFHVKKSFGSSLDDEFKMRVISEYHNEYRSWELEELLKNGKKYLKQ
jgi:hypothetical protein